ncbi:hypothetical protein [Mycobacterium sp.]|uniref:hypothetical protein n=1 Tax=Mycobacterium sp. TaxID=1785 RepID=UPI0025F49458|nr:hypothetical protein [Mycobacterium sp.]
MFSAASVLSAPLFAASDDKLARLRRRGEERVALIPSREHHPRLTGGDNDAGLDF